MRLEKGQATGPMLEPNQKAQSAPELTPNASDLYYGTGFDAYGPYTQRRMQRSNFRGGGRGHRLSAKDRFHDGKRVPAVIRRK